jgi:perosamine synthetase
MGELKVNQGAKRPLTYGRQCLSEEDKRAVLAVLDGEWLTQGPAVEMFERALCETFGTHHAKVCSNGTSALHLAALALGWGSGDVILVPGITFAASANCCAYVGAEPYFVDIDDRTLTIDPNEVERAVLRLRSAGRRVRGIVGVDMAGHPCDWVALRALADRYDLDLVDDACHAPGATYDEGVRVGACREPRITTFSFHPVKHITTGEGGAVLTNEPELAEKVVLLRSHGISRDGERIADWDGPWAYDMVELGYNYRLTDLQCALGLSQLRQLDGFVARRREIAKSYSSAFADCATVRPPEELAGVRHAYHLYLARVAFDRIGVTRRTLFERCRERDLLLQVHYRPVFMNTYYCHQPDNQGAAARLRVSCRYYRETISLPMFPDLKDTDIDYVARVLKEALA